MARGCRTARSPTSSTSARRRSRPTSAASWPSSAPATGCRQSSPPTSPGLVVPGDTERRATSVNRGRTAFRLVGDANEATSETLDHEHPHVTPAPTETAAAAGAVDARKVYGIGDAQVHALDGVDRRVRDRQVHRDHGPVRVGQVDAAALPGRARHADVGGHLHRRHVSRLARRQGPDRAAPHAGRVRVPGLQPDPDAHGRREHQAADDARRRDRRHGVDRPGRRRPSASATGSSTGRASSPAASSSASPSPARSRRGRRSSSPTSRPATSTRTTGAEILDFMRRAVREFGQTIVMVTHDPIAASYADRVGLPRRRQDRRRDARPDRRHRARPHAEASGLT